MSERAICSVSLRSDLAHSFKIVELAGEPVGLVCEFCETSWAVASNTPARPKDVPVPILRIGDRFRIGDGARYSPLMVVDGVNIDKHGANIEGTEQTLWDKQNRWETRRQGAMHSAIYYDADGNDCDVSGKPPRSVRELDDDPYNRPERIYEMGDYRPVELRHDPVLDGMRAERLKQAHKAEMMEQIAYSKATKQQSEEVMRGLLGLTNEPELPF